MSESIHVTMPHCWKSHIAAHMLVCIYMRNESLNRGLKGYTSVKQKPDKVLAYIFNFI